MLTNALNGPIRDASVVTLSLLAWQFGGVSVEANPTGGSVALGSASFNTSGSHLTINTSASSIINWQSFNIGVGETTTFVQPSSTSVVWNHINDANPSQILGSLDANGYVILQNQNGFYVGGAASIKTAGLVLTTSPAAPNLSSGGAWDFNALPPTVPIINYGQITTFGGPAYLIADSIQNYGTISAEQGKIGLYAGQHVLVSTSPDGRGLSAKVTLPQGSVDNEGHLVADGGAIVAQAKTVNNNGLLQANTVQEVNGSIELLASDSVNLGANSIVSAQGESTGASSGGSVTIQSDNNFSDRPGSAIGVAGGAQGGNGGQVEISAPQMDSLQSAISGQAATGYVDGALTIDPANVWLSSSATDPNAPNGYTVIPVNSYSGLSIKVLADNNITVNTLWALADSPSPAALTLSAGNNITLNDGSGIAAGKNWSVSLSAGTAYIGATAPAAGSDGIYLNGSAFVQTENGNINASAANEVIIQVGDVPSTSSSGAIRTLAGGNISVTTEYGNVNAGNNIAGYDFGQRTAPYYLVDPGLGGISTAAGGNVSIHAGGDVISYLPTQDDYSHNNSTHDAGSGAFGPEPGNVTITAGGSVYGNYVVANGTGIINASGNAGAVVNLTDLDADFALSLIKGSWTVNAQNIYLDDVINPNGVFNDATSSKTKAGAHYFDYDPAASLALNAANAVEITGNQVPLIPTTDTTPYGLPVLLPPTLSITAGAGGLTLDTDVILFPSASGNLSITTVDNGNFESRQNPNDPADVNTYTLEMSDSAQKQFTTSGYNVLKDETFGPGDHAPTPPEVNNPDTAQVNVSGSLNNVNLYTTLRSDITIGGNLYNSSLSTENLRPNDVSSVNVAGSISYSPIYTFVTLNQPLPNGWDSFFSILADNVSSSANYVGNPIPSSDLNNPSALKALALSDLLFPTGTPNPGFIYNPATLQLGYTYQMSSLVRSALEGTLERIVFDNGGNPEITSPDKNGNVYFQTTPVITPFNSVPASAIETLYSESQSAVANAGLLPFGFQIGGPGQFIVKAQSIDLGASGGIVSWGSGDGAQVTGDVNYGSLGALTDNKGASVSVTITGGDLDMLTSTIASINGGAVTVNDTAGQINLGLANLALTPVVAANLAFGIYTAGAGDVNVSANGSINIDTARIGTFNGGNVFVESMNGDVNAGTGANLDLLIPYYFYNSQTGQGFNSAIQGPRPFGSGILALSPTAEYQVAAGELPGNITVETPNGNIVSTLGGISQFALDNNIAGGPTVNLTAGTTGVPASATEGNIGLGQGGVLGGTVNLKATGNISGLIVSRQSTTVTAVQNINVTVVSSGGASVSGGGDVSGTVIGAEVNVSGGAISATMLSSSVSANGGAAQSTLGVATASAASQSAANQSGNNTKQELAATDANPDDEKKRKVHPLMQRVKRVTVLLPKT